MNDTVNVSIGIVTHNSSSLIASCLENIQELFGELYPIVIFDNNSKDETKTIVRTQFPQAKIIESDLNYGFGFGVNKILENATSKYVLLINPDVTLNKSSIRPLEEELENNPKTIVCAPLTLDSKGNPEFNVRRFPKLRTQLFESLLGGNIAMRISQSELVVDTKNYSAMSKIDWIKGAIWMIRRNDFVKLGGMRNDFFLYSEETEFAWRAKAAGYQLSIASESSATHIGGDSDTDPLLFSLLALNKIYMMKLTSKKLNAQILRVILVLGSLVRINKPASRIALTYLIKSYSNFENQRLDIIEKLNGTIAANR